VIVGDDAMLGSRCMVTQGARVGEGSVLGEGVILNPAIPVIDAETGEAVARGVVPPWCVVVQAMRKREFPGGEFGLPCALILRRLEPGERADTAKLNETLREHGVAT
jgi:2,3,4,5-tetrahydropyridine-2-carboxylate N-succinyltransferase